MIGGIRKSLSGVAALLAAGLLADGMAVPAVAADLGGNCCVDLEERVAELEATTVRKGNRRVSLTISGQVNTALMAWDDGRRSDVYVVDNSVSRTAFQFDGSAKINPNLTAGFEIVVALAAGARSHMVNAKDDDATAKVNLTTHDRDEAESVIAVELANWYLDHKSLGRLALGRVNTASAGTTVVDLGGARVIASAEIGSWQQGFFLTAGNDKLNRTWADILGGSPVSRSSQARGNAIAYTTPAFSGFTVSVAAGENDLWDAALRYAGEFSGFRVAAAIAYTRNHGGTDEVNAETGWKDARPTKWQGSGSIMHIASGLYLTGAHVRLDPDHDQRSDVTLWYLQGGISKNWTGLGKTVLYAEYARVDDGLAGRSLGEGYWVTSSEATVFGLGVVQHLDAAAMELFLAYRRYAAEVTNSRHEEHENLGGSLNDFDVVMGGARIRF